MVSLQKRVVKMVFLGGIECSSRCKWFFDIEESELKLLIGVNVSPENVLLATLLGDTDAVTVLTFGWEDILLTSTKFCEDAVSNTNGDSDIVLCGNSLSLGVFGVLGTVEDLLTNLS